MPNSQESPVPVVYRGRFAPSPTGPLHLGSLVAALGSYLDARAHGGVWLLRMEDIDPPRIQPGAVDAILRSLEAYGFTWDEAIVWQSQRQAAYAEALERLRQARCVYACTCNRKAIGLAARQGADGPVYPGTCRPQSPSIHLQNPHAALRFAAPNACLRFRDRLQGQIVCDMDRDLGDFVLRRADGVYSYQLAVVVDDAAQGITHVVRGADLLVSTPRQIALQQALDLPTPAYLHLPVLLDAAGNKLSKQTLATPLTDANPLPALLMAMRFLGQADAHPPATLSEFWPWAIERWSPQDLPRWRGAPQSAPVNPQSPVHSLCNP